MRGYTIKNIDVFTTSPFHGYPTAVITSAEGLTDKEMQNIAKEISLMEVVYITTSGTGKSPFRIRFFTQSEEINISGHSMIGACFALIEEGRIKLSDGVTRTYAETNDGDIPVDVYYRLESEFNSESGEGESDQVRINREGVLERIMIKQTVKSYKLSETKPEEIAEILEIDVNEIISTGFPIEETNTGLHHLLIPIKNLETLNNVKPDLIKLSIMNRKYGIQVTDLFSLNTSNDCIARTRHFAPVIGLLEAEASGMSSVAIGSYLARYGVTINKSMVFKQGNDPNNLSKVFWEVDKSSGDLNSIYIGGLATISIERKIEIDDKSDKIIFV